MPSTKVLVTGGAGFLGGNVIKVLQERDFAVRVFDFSPERLKPLEEQGIETVAGDCCDPEAVARGVDGVDAIFHLVAAPEYASKEMHERVTIGGVKTLIEAMNNAGVKRLLSISSTKAKVKYPGHYGTSKAVAEGIIKQSGLDYTVFRPALLYGPGEIKLSKMIQRVKNKKIMPIISNGEYAIWPIHAEDLGVAMVGALENPASIGKIYEVAGPTKVTFNSLTDMIAERLGRKVWKLHLPLFACYILAWMMGKCTTAPPVSIDQVRAVRAGHAVPDITEARQDLGFDPRSFEKGLDDHLEWLGLAGAGQ